MIYTFEEILTAIAEGKREVTFKFPDAKPIKGMIKQIDLTNPAWKPFQLSILTKGLTITDKRWVEGVWVG